MRVTIHRALTLLNKTWGRSLAIATLCVALACCGSASAQPDPFGGGGAAPGGDPFGGGGPAPGGNPFGGGPVPGGDPFGGEPTAPPTQPGPAGFGAQDILGDPDPFVRTIQEMNPRTPEKLMYAVKALSDYGRPKLAKQYLIKLIRLNVDTDGLNALYNEFDARTFFELLRNNDLAPEGTNFARAVLQAAREKTRDPAHIKSLVTNLSGGSISEQRAALVALDNAKDVAVIELIQTLADNNRSAEHPQVASALVQFAVVSEKPLIAALESSDDAFRTRVAKVLGRMRSRRALPFLVGPFIAEETDPDLREASGRAILGIIGVLPKQRSATQYLYKRALSFFNGEVPGHVDVDGQVEIWEWDNGQSTPVLTKYPTKDASLILAARLAKDLFAVAPKDSDAQRLFLATNLEAQKVQTGLGNPMPRGADTAFASAAKEGPTALEGMLEFAVKNHRTPAALGAIEVLGEIGGPAQVFSQNDQPTILVKMLRHRNRRIRFASANAIMKINPSHDYVGSGHLVDTLGYVVRTYGAQTALIGHPVPAHARSLSGLLQDAGFDGEIAATGRDVFKIAATNPDVEFVIISDAIDHPPAEELLQQFRKDPRTAELPVGLMARDADTLITMKAIAAGDPLVEAFVQPYSSRNMLFYVHRLLVDAGRNHVAFDERLDQAEVAVSHLHAILEDRPRYSFYNPMQIENDLVRSSLSPALATLAAEPVGLLATPKSQTALVQVASEIARPLSQRKAAAEAFAVAVKQRGILLTTDQINLQYERYNQSERLDPETQQILASILDVLEAPLNEQIARERALIYGTEPRPEN